jgi:hypothetical protein
VSTCPRERPGLPRGRRGTPSNRPRLFSGTRPSERRSRGAGGAGVEQRPKDENLAELDEEERRDDELAGRLNAERSQLSQDPLESLEDSFDDPPKPGPESTKDS